MEIHLLEVGTTQYGDCILISNNGKYILIDCAHPGDDNLITTQLQQLMGHPAPFEIDLLIITHCHADHIGCSPSLITGNVIKPKWAFVADENYGWGRNIKGNKFKNLKDLKLNAQQMGLFALLQEEDYSESSKEELEKIIKTLVDLEPGYINMLGKLNDDCSTQLIRFKGCTPEQKDDDIKRLEKAFSADFSLKIFGPTNDQIVACSKVIGNSSKETLKYIAQNKIDNFEDIISEYKKRLSFILTHGGDSIGAAKNDTSIVLTIEDGNFKAFFAGDMQFNIPGIAAITNLITQLQNIVIDGKLYDFVKLTHHTSDNGTGQEILNQYISPGIGHLGHSGGSKDKDHPSKITLGILKDNATKLEFARTDRNGTITIKKGASSNVEVLINKGALNDFDPNTG